MNGASMRADVEVGDDGLHVFNERVDGQAEPRGDHARALFEANVAEAARMEPLRHHIGGQAHAYLVLKGSSSCGCVLHALNAHALHTSTRRGERERERVHQEAGVHAGAEDTHAARARGVVDAMRNRISLSTGGVLRRGAPWPCQLLARRHHVHAARDDVKDERLELGER